MKYLFFDIECSNCFNKIGKICEFGYVLCDENLSILKKGDMPMSPGRGAGNRFHLKGRKKQKDLELAYDYDYYFEQPEFSYYYNKIKQLMEGEDTICFAFDMHNDISYINSACERYTLPKINFNCLDVQKMAMDYLKLENNNVISLHNACKKIVGPDSTIRLNEHFSRDDAILTRNLLEAICILRNISPKDLIKEYLTSNI